MDLLVGIESQRKELEAGWADVKWLLLECNEANSFMPQQYLSVTFRDGKSQSCGSEGTGKQPCRSQNSSALGNLLVDIAVSCCARHFQGGGSGSAVFQPTPCLPLLAAQVHVDREWRAQGQAGSSGQGKGRWAVQAFAGAGLYRQCICHAALPPSGLSHVPVPPSHVCCLFILSAFPQWRHLTEAQQCIAISS